MPTLEQYVEFDEKRARHVLPSLLEHWQQGNHQRVPPEVSWLPPSIAPGSTAHSHWLWLFVFANRFGQTADEIGRRAQTLVAEAPYLIDPLHICPPGSSYQLTAAERRLIGRVIPFGETDTQRVDQWWVGSLQRITSYYFGDIRNLFLRHRVRLPRSRRLIPEVRLEAMRERTALINELCQFVGVEHKLAQLALLFYKAVPWQEDAEAWQGLAPIHGVPVDVWVWRILFQTEVVRLLTDREPLTNREPAGRLLSDRISRLCLEEGWCSHDLSQALWHTGARDCAAMRRAGIGSLKASQICLACPAFEHCTTVVPAAEKNGGYLALHKAVERPRNLFG